MVPCTLGRGLGVSIDDDKHHLYGGDPFERSNGISVRRVDVPRLSNVDLLLVLRLVIVGRVLTQLLRVVKVGLRQPVGGWRNCPSGRTVGMRDMWTGSL